MHLTLPSYKTILLSLFVMFTTQTALQVMLRYYEIPALLFLTAPHLSLTSAQSGYGGQGGSGPHDGGSCGGQTNVSLEWHAPEKYFVNDLSGVINGTGIYGFIFDSSQGPANTYNWCNMPHTNPKTYPKPAKGYKLEYVEVIHRHHKRTPYASNTFPKEGYPWDCNDEGLIYGGKPLNPYGKPSAQTYWSVYTSSSNPFQRTGFPGSCQFPQITRGGLDDSHQHGADLKAVYSDMLRFVPRSYEPSAVSFRVTNNVITSQVASMLVAGMYPERSNADTPLLIQPTGIDSLEPQYSCPSASTLFSSYGSGSSSPAWLEHINDSRDLYQRLDTLSGVSPTDSGWHMSWDHYFDNLSARLCHQKSLPCNVNNTADCVSQQEADKVFRLGEYEYSFIYRDSPQSLPASVGSFGVWVAELAQNLRHAIGEGAPSTGGASPSNVKYRHNVAHDGSVSRLLAILQLQRMVWPGMGAEVVFELYSKRGCYFLRVLWGGQILESSHPSFRRMDMVPISTFLAYVDGLVGVGASLTPGKCAS